MVNGETPGAVTQKSTSRLWWPETAVPAVLSIAGVIFAFHGFQDWLTRGLWVVVLVVPVGLVAYFSMTFARAIYLEGAGLWKDPQRPAIMAAFLIAAAGVLPIILEFVKKSRENASPSDIAAAVFPPLLFTFGASVAAYVLVYVSGKVSTFEHKADELVGKVNTALDQIDGFTKQASSASTAMAGLRERTDIASSVLLEVAGDLGPYLPTASKDRRLLAAVFSPIAHSAKGWFELARRQSGGQFGMILREVIVRVGESYFREDVFDVRRRRIVTNARNYTTFLYQTARAVIRLMPPEQNSVLHYVTVTPFDPYDALNCPHPPLGMGGDSKVSYCFEEGFLGDYFSTFVRELTSAYGDRVHHRRYIIGVADKDAFLGEHPGTQQWNLSRRAQVRRASADAVIDVPFRPTDVTRADVVMKQAKLLKSYAEREHDILHNHLDNYTRELGRVAKEQERHSEDDVVFRLVFDGNALLTLDEVKAMVGNRVAALDESTKRIRAVIAGKVRPVVPSAWASLEEIADTVTETVGPVSQAFLDILTVAQELRVHMPADSIPDLDCLVSQLKHLRSALRFRDEYLVGPQAHVPTLREHFSGKFHTGHGSRDAREFFLDEGTLNRWESDFGRVPPEFALFGLGPKDAEVEVKGAVNWLLALSSTISYPWRSCEVRIVTPDATDRPALNDFEDFLCGFLKDADAY